jgi:hypothetical protein
MCDAMDHLDAGEQLFAVQAIQHGTAAANNPKDSGVQRATENLKRLATPEPDHDPSAPPAEVM